MEPLFSHIDLRVRDLEKAIRFYDELLAVFGYARQEYPDFGAEEASWRREGWSPNDEFFGIIRDLTLQPNPNRIAFRCTSREQVAHVANAVRRSGGRDVDGPADYDGYYAVFFEDPDGNLFEACYITKHGGLSGDPRHLTARAEDTQQQ